jgi:hypothetical protein
VPIVQKLMDSLVERYGPDKGKQVYYAMEAEGSGPFSPGGKYRALHEAFAKKNGVPPSHAIRTKKKPRASAKRKRRG